MNISSLIQEEMESDIIMENEIDFKDFYYDFYPCLCLFAQRYLYSKEDARDIVQDAFLEFWNIRAGFDRIEKAKSFLYTVIRNKCINHLKHKKVKERFAHQNPGSDIFFRNNVIEEEALRIIHKTINKLPSKSKEIILNHLDGLSNQEIAEKNGISVNTVKTSKLKSYRFLKENLNKYLFVLVSGFLWTCL